MILLALLVNWLTFWRETNSHAATARGSKAYEQKKYSAAVDAFRKANAVAPTPSRAFNLGTAQVAGGNREEGSAALAEAMRDPSLRAKALYNRGNAALAAKAYDYAIRDYTDALKIRPADAAAKRNLEIALRQRSMQQQSGGAGGGGQALQPPPQKQKAATPQEQPRGDPNTEALLRSVQQQEQEELSRMNRPAQRKAHVGW